MRPIRWTWKTDSAGTMLVLSIGPETTLNFSRAPFHNTWTFSSVMKRDVVDWQGIEQLLGTQLNGGKLSTRKAVRLIRLIYGSILAREFAGIEG
jgi:hypothetical protein